MLRETFLSKLSADPSIDVGFRAVSGSAVLLKLTIFYAEGQWQPNHRVRLFIQISEDGSPTKFGFIKGHIRVVAAHCMLRWHYDRSLQPPAWMVTTLSSLGLGALWCILGRCWCACVILRYLALV